MAGDCCGICCAGESETQLQVASQEWTEESWVTNCDEDDDADSSTLGKSPSNCNAQKLPSPTPRQEPTTAVEERVLTTSTKNNKLTTTTARDFDTNPTALFAALMRQEWATVMDLCEEHPGEAAVPIFRKDPTVDGNMIIRWKLLPLHASVIYGAPLHIVDSLLHTFPKGARLSDDRGMTPLHLAVREARPTPVLARLLAVCPEMLFVTDTKGRTPRELVQRHANPQTRRRILQLLDETTANCGGGSDPKIARAAVAIPIWVGALGDADSETDGMDTITDTTAASGIPLNATTKDHTYTIPGTITMTATFHDEEGANLPVEDEAELEPVAMEQQPTASPEVVDPSESSPAPMVVSPVEVPAAAAAVIDPDDPIYGSGGQQKIMDALRHVHENAFVAIQQEYEQKLQLMELAHRQELLAAERRHTVAYEKLHSESQAQHQVLTSTRAEVETKLEDMRNQNYTLLSDYRALCEKARKLSLEREELKMIVEDIEEKQRERHAHSSQCSNPFVCFA